MVPLKRFLKCDLCGRFLRIYKASKNQTYYYKFNTVGCNCNKRSDELHRQFESLLSDYILNIEQDGIHYLISEQIRATYYRLTAEGEATRSNIDSELRQVTQKLERLEERFVMEEITKAMFEKNAGILREEQQELIEGKNRPDSAEP